MSQVSVIRCSRQHWVRKGKRMKKFSGIVGAIFFLLGAVLLFAGRSFVVPAFSKPVDITEGGIEEVSLNTAVEIDLELVFERFSRRKNRDYHMVTVYGDNDWIYFMPISISSGSSGNYTEIVKESMDYLNGCTDAYGTETVPFQGVLLELDDRTEEELTKWFLENELVGQESELQKFTLPYMLYSVNFDGVRQNIIIFGWMMLIGLVLLFQKNLFGWKRGDA